MDDEYLIIRFSNENGVLDAEVGWSRDGASFARPRETARAILSSGPDDLVDLTMRQLVGELCRVLSTDGGGDDDDDNDNELAREHAARAAAYIADAIRLRRQIVYSLDADSGELPPTITR